MTKIEEGWWTWDIAEPTSCELCGTSPAELNLTLDDGEWEVQVRYGCYSGENIFTTDKQEAIAFLRDVRDAWMLPEPFAEAEKIINDTMI